MITWWKNNREFMIRVLLISVPIILQQLLLTMAGMVDSIMVAGIYRGVASTGVATQYTSIMQTVLFGVNAGMGLFLAQFYGANDRDGMKKSFALMLMMDTIVSLLFMAGALVWTYDLIAFYSAEPEVLNLAIPYLAITSLGYFGSAISFAFAVAYRNIQKTIAPLLISIIGQSINVLFNYFLIFGIAPFPQLGIAGAAWATTISNFSGAVLFILYALQQKDIFLPKWHHFKDALKPFFMWPSLNKTSLLMLNELIWSFGMTLYVKIMNDLGTNAYEGYRVAEIIVGFMLVITIGLGTAVSAMVGEQLGKKDYAKAKQYGDNFFIVGIVVALFMASVNLLLAEPLIRIFGITIPEVIRIGIQVTQVYSVRLVLRVFTVVIFSIFRAGGNVKFVTFLDAGILWIVGLPIAWIGYNWFGIRDIAVLFLVIQIEPLVRIILGFWGYKQNRWLQNLTDLGGETV